MPIHIVLLRAVNVGGTGKIAMADLRAFFEQLGFADVRTLIQSGNVVVEGGKRNGADLEAHLELEARKRLGLDTSFIVRTLEEWTQAIAANPFGEKAGKDPARLLVMALKETPGREKFESLRNAHEGPEPFELVGRHLYIDYLVGAGNSKLSNALIERKLETRGTARNWNTMLKIAVMAGG